MATSPQTTSAERLPNKKPANARTKARWAWLEKLCITAIYSSTTDTRLQSRVYPMFKLKYKASWKPPKGFPKPLKPEKHGEWTIGTFNSNRVLKWLYERYYSDYTPAMLYKMRGEILHNMKPDAFILANPMHTLKDLDIGNMKEYNSGIDLDKEKI